MRLHIRAVHWSLGVLLIATLLFSAQAFPQSNDNPEVTKLLQDGREKAADLARDADNMESLIRTDASWQTHAAMLDNIKEHVNDLGRIAAVPAGRDYGSAKLDRCAALQELSTRRSRKQLQPVSDVVL